MKELSRQIYEASRSILIEIGCHEAQSRQEQRFITAYQIWSELKKQDPPICKVLIAECGGDYVGKGAGSHVGPAQKIAQVLGNSPDIETQYILTQDLLIDGKGTTGKDCGIFRFLKKV